MDPVGKDREKLFHLFDEKCGRKLLKRGMLSQHVTTIDEDFVLLLMRDYGKILTKEGRKNDKLVGERLG